MEHDNGCCNEVLVSFLIRLMRSVFGAYGQPCEVQMRYDRNGITSAYEDYFSSPIKFWSEDESYTIVFQKADMDWAQPGHDPELFDMARKQLSKEGAQRREGSPDVDYYEVISASDICVRSGVFSVAAVAAKAGLGERTAQRIAHRHGSSVGKLIDQARLRMLREQLAQSPHICAEDLSALLGFSESRALRRAIKSWTGQSLSRFRTDHSRTKDLEQ
ncbi:MAG: helix-turn-helix domain-containing protein [Pseudomonadota bacterium]